MRRLMWFAIGFGAACAFCAGTWIMTGLFVPALIFAAVFSAGILIGSKNKLFRILTWICLGCCLGLLWFGFYSSVYLSRASAADTMTADVTARCTDYSYETDYGSAVEGFLYLEGMPYRAKFYVNSNVEMEPGDVLKGQFRLRTTTKDSADDPTFHQVKGIFLLCYQQEDAQLLKLEGRPFWAYPALFRQFLKDTINAVFPDDEIGRASCRERV